LEVVERSSAVWTVYVDLSVGTPTLSFVDDAQGVLFDPFANEGDDAGAAESAAPVIAFGQSSAGSLPPAAAEGRADSAAKSAAEIAGTAIAKDPLKLNQRSIRIPDPDSAPLTRIPSEAQGRSANSAANSAEPAKLGSILDSGAFAQTLIELNDPARWAEVVRKFEGEVERLVPWPLQAASRTRIAELLADGDLTRAELLRTVDATERYERAGTLRGAPGSDPADWPGASVVRLVQRKLDDKGRGHLWWRGKGRKAAEAPR